MTCWACLESKAIEHQKLFIKLTHVENDMLKMTHVENDTCHDGDVDLLFALQCMKSMQKAPLALNSKNATLILNTKLNKTVEVQESC